MLHIAQEGHRLRGLFCYHRINLLFPKSEESTFRVEPSEQPWPCCVFACRIRFTQGQEGVSKDQSQSGCHYGYGRRDNSTKFRAIKEDETAHSHNYNAVRLMPGRV
jgi:hypothetical protein